MQHDDIKPVEFSSRRKARVESFLKREIATCVTNELNDPRIGFVTITRCEMSPDNSEVTAYYTVLDPAKRHLAQKALDSARGYVQRSYAKDLRMKHLPRLLFSYDDIQLQRNAMDELIAEARATDPNPGPEDGDDDTADGNTSG